MSWRLRLAQDALQKENSRLADANHTLGAQLAGANAQRSEAVAKWAEKERALRGQLAGAEVHGLPWPACRGSCLPALPRLMSSRAALFTSMAYSHGRPC